MYLVSEAGDVLLKAGLLNLVSGNKRTELAVHLNEPLSSFIPYVNGTQCKYHNNVPKYGGWESLTPGGKQVAVSSRTVPVPVCFHCNMKGHKVPDCPKPR